MPAEQEIPEVPRVEISALTEEQMCKPGAVKIIYSQLTELKMTRGALLSDLQLERQRTESMTNRAHSSELAQCALRERLRSSGNRDAIARLIEFVITIVLAYAIDFAKSGNWKSSVVFITLSATLALAVWLLNRGVPDSAGGPNGK